MVDAIGFLACSIEVEQNNKAEDPVKDAKNNPLLFFAYCCHLGYEFNANYINSTLPKFQNLEILVSEH